MNYYQLRTVQVVHRIIGLTITLPIILLVVTGVPLQFSQYLQLGQHGIPYAWVLDMYGIQAPTNARQIGSVVQLEDVLLIGERIIPTDETLIGAVEIDSMTIVALDGSIRLVPQDPTIPIEVTVFDGQILAFGQTSDLNLLLNTSNGAHISSDLGATWELTDNLDNKPTQVIERAAKAQWQSRYRASKITWERWLQDLHSGRFFGVLGEWIMALAGLALLGLAGTGIWVWSRR